ncbi:hypothetical protein V1512DRAFT_267738 [Lipomyces arxii]|uniref:uncharacterized protein n=1 Tax=Lipomyces arxii TaxID=56418 RepID=UPI0034CD4375
MTTIVPVIDISDPSPETVKKLYEVASTFGFVFIEGSAFTASDVDGMFRLAKEFFMEPINEKQKFPISSTNRGYSCVNQEVLDDKSNKGGDPKEVFNFGQFEDSKAIQPLPKVFSDCESDIAAFASKCHATCNKLLDLLAEALAVDHAAGGKTWFSSRHDLKEFSGSILRFLYYPAVVTGDGTNEIRAGAHTDYGSMTLLFQRAGQDGLEVQSPLSGEWVPIPALKAKDPSACPPIVVNIADQLSFWTAGVLKSAVHRVKFPIEAVKRGSDRYSMAYFCHPADNILLEPVPSPVIKASSLAVPTGADVITAGEHLKRRLAATYSWKD